MAEQNQKKREPWFEFDEKHGPTSQKIRELAKWVLDFIRNVAVVGAISYFANVSESTVLRVVAWIGMGCLTAYLYSYLEQTRFNRLFPVMKYRWLAASLEFVIFLIVVGGGFMLLNVGTNIAVREIAEAYQSTSK